jgi:type VI protein secretion system component VasF
MSTPLIALCEPFFLKVLGLVNSPAAQTEQLPQLQRQLTADLQAIEQKVASGATAVSQGEWQSLKRVLIYWADEILTHHMPEWEDYVLEHEYYGERNRAWKFYVEGENCVPTGSSEAAELFYLAVVLGFTGDIEGAFKYELNKELPGKKSDLNEARKFWAAQLQRRIRHEGSGDIQGEPLEGNVEPLSGTGMYKAAFASSLIGALGLLIVVGWWLMRANGK